MKLSSSINVYHTPWFNLIEKMFVDQDSPYYSLQMQDYVTAIAQTKKKEIIIVSQFRPCVEEYTFEFPSGHIGDGEDSTAAAVREFNEETGYICKEIELLGTLYSDTGRHENRLLCYWIEDAELQTTDYLEKNTISVHLKSKTQLKQMITSGQFCHALDIAVLGMAQVMGKL